jgi:nitrogen fixation/metabolism regulation signal transduction histidine kinase
MDFKYEFIKATRHFKKIRQEKEAEFQYLRNIVQHIGIGIITFKKSDGEIQIFNTAAKRILRVSSMENIEELELISSEFYEAIQKLTTGGRDLLRLYLGEDIMQLAIYVIELNLRGDEYKLISLQNIQSELEENEMAAWQNLVRVLTHEIMNSITPISSLSDTVKQEIAEYVQSGQPVDGEALQDFEIAISAIQKRSEGLIRFVQDFRNLTQIPDPKFSHVLVDELVKEVMTLLKTDIENSGVEIIIDLEPSNISINADKELISQVLINLIKNALEAFDSNSSNRFIKLSARFSEKSRPIITVEDNGSGIDEDALQRIFIPFYTTKKKGSGIGLSLSRQVMRQHQGSLTVKTEMDKGTTFFLRF